MKRVNIHFSEQQISRLQVLSTLTGLNVAEHVRRAVDRYLDAEEAFLEEKTVKEEAKR